MATTEKKATPTKVIIPCRFSYAYVFEPHAMEDDGDKAPKYQSNLLIPKSDTKTIDKIKQAIKIATEEGKPKWGNKVPPGLWNPLRDGDVERSDDPNYADHYFVNAKSGSKPNVVDAALNAIIDPDDFYSGCYGRASVTFFAFNNKMKGIAAGLNNAQKLKDGDRFSTRSSAEEDFGDLSDLDGDDDDLLG